MFSLLKKGDSRGADKYTSWDTCGQTDRQADGLERRLTGRSRPRQHFTRTQKCDIMVALVRSDRQVTQWGQLCQTEMENCACMHFWCDTDGI